MAQLNQFQQAPKPQKPIKCKVGWVCLCMYVCVFVYIIIILIGQIYLGVHIKRNLQKWSYIHRKHIKWKYSVNFNIFKYVLGK